MTKKLRRGDGLWTVGIHGDPDGPGSSWDWCTTPERAAEVALNLAKRLVSEGRPDAKIHCDSSPKIYGERRIMTATAQQWVDAAAEVEYPEGEQE